MKHSNFLQTSVTICIALVTFCNITLAVATNPPTEILLKLIDSSNQTAVSDAHVCIELNDGSKSYCISNENGEISMPITKMSEGSIAISKVGYITRYLNSAHLRNGITIAIQPDVFDIDQVIVTGQSKPTPIDSSIYKVKLITAEKIQKLGAVNLSELITTESNIRISSDLILGSQIEMLGMSGPNVKIMVDGVPVIGRLSGNIDLSQINLANIKQVEIIEGPMSVVYGNNALAGTINLITKQNSYYNTTVDANTYAESVGRISANATVSKKMKFHTISFDGGYEYFNGVDFNTSDRSMEWKPKTLYRFNGSYTYSKNNWTINAKAGLYTDELLNKGDVANFQAMDMLYFTDRYDFSTQIKKNWKKSDFNLVSSYNLYQRSTQEYSKNLTTLESVYQDKVISQEASQFMMRAIFSTPISKISFQSGVDIEYEEMPGERILNGKANIGDYAIFAHAKYKIAPTFEIQPGLRYAYNTEYNAPLVYSFNTKWNLNSKINWRASFAKGFRAPDIKELFYVFVDSNHEIYGNPNLKAESSYNYNTSLEYFNSHPINNWKANISAYYNDVKNQIVLVQDMNKTSYTYQNFDVFKSTGANIDINYGYKSIFTIRGGYGLTARYNKYESAINSDKFKVSHDLFAGINFNEPKTHINFTADYKYNGKIKYFYLNDDDVVSEAEQDGYNTLSASVSKSFFKKLLTLTGGAKNIMDVTNVVRSGGSSGAHSSGNNLPISYGRSYYINLILHFAKSK